MSPYANQKLYKVVIFLMMYTFSLSTSCSEGSGPWGSFIKDPNQNNYRDCSKEIELSLSGDYEQFRSPSYIALTQNDIIGKILDLTEGGNVFAANLTLQFYPLFWRNPELHEFIDISLGKLIKKTPELFLELIKKYFDTSIKDFDGLKGILRNYGEEFVDDYEKQLKETEERISSLQKVNRKDLIGLRDNSIVFLIKEKEFLEKRKTSSMEADGK